MRLWEMLRGLFAERREPSLDDDDGFDPENPFGEQAEFPLRDFIDLHGLPPKMVREVVESYLDEARRLGFTDVRIIHGKGIGVQREAVRAILARTAFVVAYADAPQDAGGWGATVARLAPPDAGD